MLDGAPEFYLNVCVFSFLSASFGRIPVTTPRNYSIRIKSAMNNQCLTCCANNNSP